MIGTGAGALRSIGSAVAPSVSTSWSCTILTTIWPGVTDFTTSTPTARSRSLSTKSRTTSRATSASRSARRTSRAAASTSAAVSAPRRVNRSRMPDSLSDRPSNMGVLSQTQNSPEGAQRCRALTSSLTGAGRLIILSSCREPGTLMADPTQSHPQGDCGPRYWPPRLFQSGTVLAEPAFVNLGTDPLQDRHHPSDTAGRNFVGRFEVAFLVKQMAGLDQFVMGNASRDDFRNCG